LVTGFRRGLVGGQLGERRVALVQPPHGRQEEQVLGECARDEQPRMRAPTSSRGAAGSPARPTGRTTCMAIAAPDARRRATLLDGVLLMGGAVALFDNALVHWVLGWHRLVDGWSGTLYAELALSLAGTAMLAVAVTRLRRHPRRTGATARRHGTRDDGGISHPR
jgi:hypothetical protein